MDSAKTQHCDFCSAPATVWVTLVLANGHPVQAALCESHTQTLGMLDAKGYSLLEPGVIVEGAAVQPDADVSEILKTALEAIGKSKDPKIGALAPLIAQAVSHQTGRGSALSCPRCGFTMADWNRLGRLGCAGCYEAFRTFIAANLPPLHGGSSSHMGKIPERGGAIYRQAYENRIRHWQQRLDSAVSKEAYEQAAEARDHIREIRSGLEKRYFSD